MTRATDNELRTTNNGHSEAAGLQAYLPPSFPASAKQSPILAGDFTPNTW